MSKKRHILVVEDEPIARMCTQLIFESRGFDVDCATTGQEALNYLATKHYGVILMDIGLPDMDGLTVTQRYRDEGTDTQRKTPVIALTAQGLEKASGVYDHVFNAVIQKPLLEEHVDAFIEQWVGDD